MADALFTIRSAFSIKGLGLCLDTGVSVDRRCPIREGQHLILKDPGGSELRVTVRAVEYLLLSASPPRENYAVVIRERDIDSKAIPAGTEAFALDEDWRRPPASEPICWTGDLDDDCTARWAGLILRAEEMERGFWWWCVYDEERQGLQIASSNEAETTCPSGVDARMLAEEAARTYLESLANNERAEPE